MQKNNKKLFSAVCVMLLVSVIGLVLVSGTYAKYVTETSGTDTARVARWGFDKETDLTLELFAESYDGTAVSSEEGENIVAPGTTLSEEIAFDSLLNTEDAPEVDYSFGVTISGTISDDLKAKLLFQLDDGEWLGFDAFKTAASTALTQSEIKAGNLPTAEGAHTVSWKWAFEGTGDDTAKAAYDTSDTALGNAEELAEAEITFTVVATQLD